MAMMFRGLGKPTDQLDISLAQPSNVLANPVGMSTPPIAPQQQAPQQTMRQQMYGDLPMWKILLGTALDNIAQQTGGTPAFSQGLQMQRQQNQRAQAAASERQADWQDWVQKQVWQRDNPAPQPFSEFERTLIGSGIQPGTPEWQQAFITRRDNQLDPWTNIVVGGNSVSGRQSAVQRAIEGGGGLSSPQAGGAAIPPTAPVGKLRPLGGGTPSASNSFR